MLLFGKDNLLLENRNRYVSNIFQSADVPTPIHCLIVNI